MPGKKQDLENFRKLNVLEINAKEQIHIIAVCVLIPHFKAVIKRGLCGKGKIKRGRKEKIFQA